MNQGSEQGFKPGANMPHDNYDPKQEGMSESGNHAVGHTANDVPSQRQRHQPSRAEPDPRQREPDHGLPGKR